MPQNGPQVLFRGRNGFQVIAALQFLHHPGREERGQGGTQPDVPDAQSQQGDQDADCLLLEPAEHQRERQVVDGAAEGIGQSQCDPDGAVCIVALAHI